MQTTPIGIVTWINYKRPRICQFVGLTKSQHASAVRHTHLSLHREPTSKIVVLRDLSILIVLLIGASLSRYRTTSTSILCHPVRHLDSTASHGDLINEIQAPLTQAALSAITQHARTRIPNKKEGAS
jgi:hypothetical protein